MSRFDELPRVVVPGLGERYTFKERVAHHFPRRKKTAVITTKVTPELKQQMVEEATKLGITLSALIALKLGEHPSKNNSEITVVG